MPNNNFNQTPFLQSGDPTIECRAVDSYVGQLGYRFTFITPADTRPRRFQLVKCDSAMTVAPYEGAVAWWKDRATYLVTTSASATGRGNVAGVFRNRTGVGVGDGSLTSQNYPNTLVCIQIKGPAPVDFSAGTPLATGLFVIPTATDATAEAVAAGTAAAYPPMGKTISAAGVPSGTLAQVDLELDGEE